MADISVLLDLSLSKMGKDILANRSNNRKKINPEISRIQFGQLAFVKESAWKRSEKHRAATKKRISHPGLCVSENSSKMAFGTSKTEGRDRNSLYYFYVSGSESEVISNTPTTVFLLDFTVPINWYDIDVSESTIGALSPDSMKRLRKRIKNIYPHYLTNI